MAIRYLSDMSNERPGKKMQLDIAGAGTTDWVIIDKHPDGINTPITVGITPTAGNAKIQMTNDDIISVLTSAASTDWAAGLVTGCTLLEIPSPVTAVRAVTTGAAKMTIQR